MGWRKGRRLSPPANRKLLAEPQKVVWPLVGLRSLCHYRSARACRSRLTDSLWIACESDPCELPAFFRLKEISIGAADMNAGCRAGTTAQDILVAHEFAVVLAKRAGSSAVAGVGRVGAARPFPNVAEHLVKTLIFSRFVR